MPSSPRARLACPPTLLSLNIPSRERAPSGTRHATSVTPTAACIATHAAYTTPMPTIAPRSRRPSSLPSSADAEAATPTTSAAALAMPSAVAAWTRP